MTQQHRKDRWPAVRSRFVQRTFPPRVARELDALDVKVDDRERQVLLSGRGLFLHGAVGSGKTLYAAATVLSAARHRYVYECRAMPSACLIPVTRLLRDLRDAMRQQGEVDGERLLMDRLAWDTELLVMDDLGAEKLTEWSLQVLQEIINERYERELPLIVTTNADGLEGLAQFLGDARIPSRLGAMCAVRDFGDTDHRPAGVGE